MFIDQVQRNRFELKYLIDERIARTIRDFARGPLIRDRYARPELAWCYPIYSVYLDSADLATCRASEEGLRNRIKLRLRFYDPDPARPVFCEIKRRVNSVVLKERAMIHRPAATRLLAGYRLDRTDLVVPEDLKALSSLNRFAELQQTMGAVGQAFVTYMREAWTTPDDNGVRLTFDYQIRGAWYGGGLELPTKWAFLPLNPKVVLELKFTSRFPAWMGELVQSCDLTRGSIAKYVGCVQALQQQRFLRVSPIDGHEDNDD